MTNVFFLFVNCQYLKKLIFSQKKEFKSFSSVEVKRSFFLHSFKKLFSVHHNFLSFSFHFNIFSLKPFFSREFFFLIRCLTTTESERQWRFYCKIFRFNLKCLKLLSKMTSRLDKCNEFARSKTGEGEKKLLVTF